jgi:hypothetical protein
MHGWSFGVGEERAGLVLIYTVWVSLLRAQFHFDMTTFFYFFARRCFEDVFVG